MFAALHKALSPRSTAHGLWAKVLRHKAWLLVGLTVLFVLVVRVRLRDMPLERDEGEYAYAGQLMLHGLAPYKDGLHHEAARHLRRLRRHHGRSSAKAPPASTSASPSSTPPRSSSCSSWAGNCWTRPRASRRPSPLPCSRSAPRCWAWRRTRRISSSLAALAGMLLLLQACEPGNRGAGHERRGASSGRSCVHPQPLAFFVSGLCFGLAFLMKQHGLFFGLCGALYLLWTRIGQWLTGELEEVPLTQRDHHSNT